LDQPDTSDAVAQPSPLGGWRALLRDLFQMVRFYSRLPLPRLPFETDAHAIPDFRTAPRFLPIAGLIIGVPAAAILYGALRLGLPPFIATALAVATAVIATGAMHEDGLADTFDGLGGGRTRERRLEILKDSRSGASGAAALILSLTLRIAALAALAERTGPGAAALLMLAAAAWSRTIALLPLVLLAPARPDGASAAVGRPSARTFATALALVFASIGTLILPFGAFSGGILLGILLGLLLGAGLALAITGWAWRAIRGQTGDIAGACQQIAEIAFYVGLLIFFSNG
jgi:adenosylcobinamide-GDP ribazoletransferase